MFRGLLALLLAVSLAGEVARSQEASRVVEYCAQQCHRWLIDDPAREAIADVRLSTTGSTHRIRYAADWLYSEPCPKGRLEFARRIVGTRELTAFSSVLIHHGFCPRVTIEGVAPDAPYFVSESWDELVLDDLRSQMLTRAEFERHAIPALQRIFTSASPHRWTTFGLVVATNTDTHADLLIPEIREMFFDPEPSRRQELADGSSSKYANVRRVADALDRNTKIVNALLDDLDVSPLLAGNPGYRRLLDNLAGIYSSVPSWGTPSVCANVDRIARHLPWERDAKADATFLATLSRCDRGSENLIRRSLYDGRPVITATALRVWSLSGASGRTVARDLMLDVTKYLETHPLPLPDAQSLPVYLYGEQAQRMVRDGTAIEDIATGLSALGELSRTVANFDATGRPDLARALTEGAEHALQRLRR